jgi:hypothetical protein
MEVTDISEITYEEVEINEGPWTTYRRYSSDNWEVSMGTSWEPYYFPEKVEAAYQRFKRKGKK